MEKLSMVRGHHRLYQYIHRFCEQKFAAKVAGSSPAYSISDSEREALVFFISFFFYLFANDISYITYSTG